MIILILKFVLNEKYIYKSTEKNAGKTLLISCFNKLLTNNITIIYLKNSNMQI